MFWSYLQRLTENYSMWLMCLKSSLRVQNIRPLIVAKSLFQSARYSNSLTNRAYTIRTPTPSITQVADKWVMITEHWRRRYQSTMGSNSKKVSLLKSRKRYAAHAQEELLTAYRVPYMNTSSIMSVCMYTQIYDVFTKLYPATNDGGTLVHFQV